MLLPDCVRCRKTTEAQSHVGSYGLCHDCRVATLYLAYTCKTAW